MAAKNCPDRPALKFMITACSAEQVKRMLPYKLTPRNWVRIIQTTVANFKVRLAVGGYKK